MPRTFALHALCALLAFGAVVEAQAWERSATIAGPSGTASVSASGSCSGTACSRTVTRSRSYAGGTVTRTVTSTGTRAVTGTVTGAVTRTVTGTAAYPHAARRVVVAPRAFRPPAAVVVAPRVYVPPARVVVVPRAVHPVAHRIAPPVAPRLVIRPYGVRATRIAPAVGVTVSGTVQLTR